VYLPSGSDFCGTKKRAKDTPFTYLQELSKNDKRSKIDTLGGKTLFLKRLAHPSGKTVRCYGYRNGNGGVTLAYSTFHDGYDWEFVVLNHSDLEWYDRLPGMDDNEKIHICYFPLRINGSEHLLPDTVEALVDLQLNVLTREQVTPEWFLMRFASFTSRSGYFAFNCIYKQKIANWIEQSDNEDSGNENNDNPWRIIADFAGKPYEDPEEANDDEEDPNIGEEDGEDNYVISLEAVLEEKDLCYDADELLIGAQDEKYELYKQLLVKGGGNLSKANSAVTRQRNDFKNLAKWFKAPIQIRPIFFNQKRLKEAVIGLKLFPLVGSVPNGVEDLRKSLTTYFESNPDQTRPLIFDDTEAASEKTLDDSEKLLKQCLESYYLKKLEGKPRQYARRGSELEEPVLQRFVLEMEKTPHLYNDLKILQIVRVGLVQRISRPWVKASIDAIASIQVADVDGYKMVSMIGIEVKSRVTDKTAQQELETQVRARLNDFSKRIGRKRRKRKYIKLNATDPRLKNFVSAPHELIQLLHHAYVCKLNHVLWLVGDKHANIIAGVIVKFSDEMKAAWDKILRECYDMSLRQFYDDSEEMWSDERLQKVCEQVVLNKKGRLDLHTLKQQVYLWQNANKQLNFPLPVCKMMIPAPLAFHNDNKGGSDIQTRLGKEQKVRPPTKTLQGDLIGLHLDVVAIQIHRLMQIATAKPNLISAYASLKHFRQANNKRRSFKYSLLEITNVLVAFAKQAPVVGITGM
jgi:hypothetical protein